MTRPEYLNLYVYSDSLAFRRKQQSQDLQFLYPFVLKGLIESRLGIRTNLVMRGNGGALVRTVHATLLRDTGFFGFSAETINIAVLQCGVVDCAPQPFTYALAPMIRSVPIVGEKILAFLGEHRRTLQSFWSYRAVSKRRFVRHYANLLRTCRVAALEPIAVGMPLPTLGIEQRSPGFRQSVAAYNPLIQQSLPDRFCDIEAEISEADRDLLLLDDGHHLTEAGHQLYAESIYRHVERIVAERVSAQSHSSREMRKPE